MANTQTAEVGWWRNYDSTATEGRRYSHDTMGSPRVEHRSRTGSLTATSSGYTPSISYTTISSVSTGRDSHVNSMESSSSHTWSSSSPVSSRSPPRNARKPPPSPSMNNHRDVPSYDKYYWNTSRNVPAILKIYHRTAADSESSYSSTLPRDRYTHKPPTGLSSRDTSASSRSLQDIRRGHSPSPSQHLVHSSTEASSSSFHSLQNYSTTNVSSTPRVHHTTSSFTHPLSTTRETAGYSSSLSRTQHSDSSFSHPLSAERTDYQQNGASRYRRGLGTPVLYRRTTNDKDSQGWDGGLRRTLRRSTEDLRTVGQRPFSRDKPSSDRTSQSNVDTFNTSVRDSTEDLRTCKTTQKSELSQPEPATSTTCKILTTSDDVLGSTPTEKDKHASLNGQSSKLLGNIPLHNGTTADDLTKRSADAVVSYAINGVSSRTLVQQAPPSNHDITTGIDSAIKYEEHTVTTLEYPTELMNQQRQRSQSAPALPSPILKKVSQFTRGGFSRSRRPPLKKQTSFKEEVKIIRYDDDENKATTDSGPLREEGSQWASARQNAKASSGEVFTTQLETSVRSVTESVRTANMSQSVTSDEKNSQDNPNEADLLLEEAARKYAQSASGSPDTSPKTSNPNETSDASLTGPVMSIFQSKTLEFLPGVVGTGGSQQRSKIRLMLRLGTGYIHSQTTVKALSGGLSLIVVTYRSSLASDGSIRLHQYREKLALPVKVDPYSMRAFMQKSGELHIQALVSAD